MGEHKPFGDGAAVAKAYSIYQGKHHCVPKPISLLACMDFATINLHVFNKLSLNTRSANLTLPSRQL